MFPGNSVSDKRPLALVPTHTWIMVKYLTDVMYYNSHCFSKKPIKISTGGFILFY